MRRYLIKLLCKLLKIIEEIIMKLIPKFCGKKSLFFPSICEHMDRFIGADDVTLIQGADFDPLADVIAVDEDGHILPFTVKPTEIADTCQVGTYTFLYMTESFVHERIVTIVQASAPTFSGLTSVTTGYMENFDTLQGVTATDAHGESVTVTCLEGSSVLCETLGDVTLHYTAEDACGNVGTAERVITVEAGHFEGLADASVNQGLGFDLEDGVTAYTYSGSQTTFSVDPSEIDACELGEQEVTYTAQGLLPETRTITVLPIANPTISGIDDPIEVEPSEEFDPLDGVTATDGNGNDISADVTVREMTYRTVLYNDGTFIINEKETDYEANTALHNGVANTYAAFDPNGSTDAQRYKFDYEAWRPWHNQRTSVKSVEVGSYIKPTSIKYWFSGMNKCESMDVSMLDARSVTDASEAFRSCSMLTSLDLSMWQTTALTNMSSMFNGCTALASLNVSNFNTSKVTDMSNTFTYCRTLTSLDVSSFNTSVVATMKRMFSNCSALTSLDVSNFDTSKVTNFESMFGSCTNLATIDVSRWNVGLVTDMSNMFSRCSSLANLDVSRWNTSAVSNFGSMFNACTALTSLDVSNWNTASATGMEFMFSSTKLSSLDLSQWNTSLVTSMRAMFSQCSSLTSLDLSGFNTANVTNMSSMFENDGVLAVIYASADFVTSAATSSANMFNNCYVLTGGAGTAYNQSNPKDKTYAKIDGGTSDPGYFTAKA